MSNTTSDTTSDITFNSTPDTTPDTTSRHIRSEIFIIYWAFIKLIEKIEKKKNELFIEYFGYQRPSFLAEHLINANNSKNNQIANHVISSINR